MVLSLPEYYIIAIACYIYIFWDEWYWNIVFRFYFLCHKIDKNGEPGDSSSKEIEISVKLLLTRHLFPPFSIQNMMKNRHSIFEKQNLIHEIHMIKMAQPKIPCLSKRNHGIHKIMETLGTGAFGKMQKVIFKEKKKVVKVIKVKEWEVFGKKSI